MLDKKRVPTGTKVRKYSSAFDKTDRSQTATVGGETSGTTTLYQLLSPDYLSGEVWRAREEFDVVTP